MRMRIEMRLRNAEVARALEQAGWTQTDLARRMGVHPTCVCNVLNMKSSGSYITKNGVSKILISKMEKAFAEAGVCFDPAEAWPEDFKGLSRDLTRAHMDVEVDHRRLAEVEYERRRLTEYVAETDIRKSDLEILPSLVSNLGRRKRKMVEGFISGKSIAQMARECDMSKENSRMILAQGILDMRCFAQTEHERVDRPHRRARRKGLSPEERKRLYRIRAKERSDTLNNVLRKLSGGRRQRAGTGSACDMQVEQQPK